MWVKQEGGKKGYAQSGGRTPITKIEDMVRLFKFTTGSTTVRLMGPELAVAVHHVNLRPKDADKSRKTFTHAEVKKSYRRATCLGYDFHSDTLDESKCPFCQMGHKPTIEFYSNAIIRDVQEQGRPAKAAVPKGKTAARQAAYWAASEKEAEEKYVFMPGTDSKIWTPVSVVKLPVTLVDQIGNMVKTNKVNIKNKKTGKTSTVVKGPNDPKNGFDITVSFDNNKPPALKYFGQKDGKNALGEEELALPIWDLGKISSDIMTPVAAERAAAVWKDLFLVKTKSGDFVLNPNAGKGSAANDDDAGDEDEDGEVKKSSKKGKTSKPHDDDEFDEDEKLVVKKKASKPAAKAPAKKPAAKATGKKNPLSKIVIGKKKK